MLFSFLLSALLRFLSGSGVPNLTFGCDTGRGGESLLSSLHVFNAHDISSRISARRIFIFICESSIEMVLSSLFSVHVLGPDSCDIIFNVIFAFGNWCVSYPVWIKVLSFR